MFCNFCFLILSTLELKFGYVGVQIRILSEIAFLGDLGGLSERSWAVLGWSGAVLGHSLAALGSFWAVIFDRFGAVFDRLDAVIDRKWTPKRSICIRLELPGPPKGLAVRVEFKC